MAEEEQEFLEDLLGAVAVGIGLTDVVTNVVT